VDPEITAAANPNDIRVNTYFARCVYQARAPYTCSGARIGGYRAGVACEASACPVPWTASRRTKPPNCWRALTDHPGPGLLYFRHELARLAWGRYGKPGTIRTFRSSNHKCDWFAAVGPCILQRRTCGAGFLAPRARALPGQRIDGTGVRCATDWHGRNAQWAGV